MPHNVETERTFITNADADGQSDNAFAGPAIDLRQAQFTVAAARLNQLPTDTGAEVAFAGRSNAGKSTALNAIAGRKALARTSRTPGRTQQIVVFELEGDKRLIDLPGYGYAKVPDAVRRQWGQVLENYFTQRRSLAGLVLIMDCRHPLKETDWQMLEYAAASALPVHVLLSKADKLNQSQRQKTLNAVHQETGSSVQLFSGTRKTGVKEARAVVTHWLRGGG